MCFWIVKVIHSQYRPPLIGVSSIQKETPSSVCQGLPEDLVQLDINENRIVWMFRYLRSYGRVENK